VFEVFKTFCNDCFQLQVQRWGGNFYIEGRKAYAEVVEAQLQS
jgi:predicted SpoU family rRNA methylase